MAEYKGLHQGQTGGRWTQNLKYLLKSNEPIADSRSITNVFIGE